MNTHDLQPGPELDAMVAKAVNMDGSWHEWFPSIRADHAFDAIEAWRKIDPCRWAHISTPCASDHDEYQVNLFDEDEDARGVLIGRAPTLPLAISRAIAATLEAK